MASSHPIVPLPSVAVFGPQSKIPSDEYLAGLRCFIRSKTVLEPFVKAIEDLPLVWKDILPFHEGIAALDDGPRDLQSLSDWISSNEKLDMGVDAPSGMLALPLLLIIHLSQYLIFLDQKKIAHSEMMNHFRSGAGIHGYCGGMFAASCIACSGDEEEIVQNACIAIRTAVGIGACAELEYDNPSKLSSIMVVRVKHNSQAEELVAMFPGTRISAITDFRTVSISGPPDVLAQLREFAVEQKLTVQMIPLRGNMHNPESSKLASEYSQFCDSNEAFKLPYAESLLVPFRSNFTTELIREGSLSHEIARTILAEKCRWYQLLTEIAMDLNQTSHTTHSIAAFGIGDFISLKPFHQAGLKITKIDMYAYLSTYALNPSQEASPPVEFPGDAIAVVGMACRYPGANSTEDLWNIISTGKSTVQEVPKNRVDFEASYRARSDHKWASKHKFYGNFISHHDCFDHNFFGISKKEATYMDPQQCLLLETAYQAMESSGYISSTQARDEGHKFGVFIGASFVDYLEHSSAQTPNAYAATGTLKAFLSGKISHYYGWTGPSEVIDTACSSSLVAISRGVRSLQRKECTAALVGGVNFLSTPTQFLDLGRAGFLSPTGQCKPFDVSADGYCRGEGVGLIVLKSLADATASGDNILGVIPSISTSHGSNPKSITVPHAPSQLQLYKDILRESSLDSSHVSYIEAHGTGTQVGDPIEIDGIRQGFATQRRKNSQEPLYLGSIKANIGHCECSAGVAGVIKSILMVNKAILPPLAGFKQFNPKIPAIKPDNITISTISQPWNAPFRAMVVNSYGATGSNSALLMCQPSQRPSAPVVCPSGSPQSFPVILTAASKNSLVEYTKSLKKYLQSAAGSVQNIGNVAYTLSEHRKYHKFSWTSITNSTLSLAKSLDDLSSSSYELPDIPRKVILSFSGQFRQFVGLDKRYYDSCPLLQNHLDQCDKYLIKTGSQSIFPAIFHNEPVSDAEALQCSIFCLQYSSARSWIDCGLKVDAVVGHSLGELTAMAVSGVLSMESALDIIISRARLVKSKWGAERGSMLAIHATELDVGHIISLLPNGTEEVEIACYNSRESQVVVGTALGIAAVENLLLDNPTFRNVRISKVDTSHGFHSRFTDGLLDGLHEAAKNHLFASPQILLESCTREALDDISSPRITEHMRQPVFFQHAIRRLEERFGSCIFLEAGLDSPIIPMIKKAVDTPQSHVFLPVKLGTQPPMETLSNVTTKLWQQGLPVSFFNFHTPGYQQVWLPPYQFERTPAYLQYVDPILSVLDSQKPVVIETQPATHKEVLRLVNPSNKDSKTFSIGTRTERFQSIVVGHNVIGYPLCPAALYLECAIMAVKLKIGNLDGLGYEFWDFHIDAPLGINHSQIVMIAVDGENAQSKWSFTLNSASRDSKSKPTVHAKANFKFYTSLQGQRKSQFQYHQRFVKERLDNFQSRLDIDTFGSNRTYKLFSRVVNYSKNLQGISRVSIARNEVVADLDLPVTSKTDESSSIGMCNAIALDNFVQVVGVLINTSDICSEDEAYLATGADSIIVAPGCDLRLMRKWRVYASFSLGDNTKATGDIFVLTPEYSLAATIIGMHFSKLPMSALGKILSPKSTANNQAKLKKEKEDIAVPLQVCSTQVRSNSGLLVKVKSVVSEFSGVPHDQISNGISMSDLGIDSLAAIELIAELSSQFQIEIGGTDVASATIDDLLRLYSATRDVGSFDTEITSTISSDNSIQTPATEPSGVVTVYSGLHEEILNTVAEFAAIDLSSITEDATFEALGIDSLSLVELKSTMEEKYSITQDLDLFTTVGGLLSLLAMKGVSYSLIEATTIQKASPMGVASATLSTDSLLKGNDILKLIAEYAALEESSIYESSTLEELGIDSLSLIELKSAMEEILETELSFDLSSTVHMLRLMVEQNTTSPVRSQKTGSITATFRSSGTSSPQASHFDTQAAVDDSNPSYLGDPLDAIKTCHISLDAFGGKKGYVEFWDSFVPKQENLVLVYIIEAFRELGADLYEIQPGSVTPRIHYTAQNSCLMERLWSILEGAGIVAPSGSSFIRSNGMLPIRSSAVLMDELLRAYPQYETDLKLLAATGGRLAECLAGEAHGVRLLFGNPTNLNILNKFYKHSVLFKATTDLLLDIIKQAVPANNGTPIKIIEVGGGTGSTTIQICNALQSRNCSIEYTFTDISSTLVKVAEKELSKTYPWMNFCVLDLEKDASPCLQGKYDIVIGANVVHATSDVVKSCSRIRSLLRHDGFVALLELTPHATWFDLVFGLLSGWWSAKDGRKYALQSPDVWSGYMRQAGFPYHGSSTHGSREPATQQLIIGSLKRPQTSSSFANSNNWDLETIPYKTAGDLDIEADIYYPPVPIQSHRPMAIALMIHGGGFITLSRRAVRPYQTAYLLSQNILPVSIDYRLCPEIDILSGPMNDVRDAVIWARDFLPGIVKQKGFLIDPEKLVVIGWSTGGHLALTTAWTTLEAGVKPPKAILSFYAPTDFQSDYWGRTDLGKALPGSQMSIDKIREALSNQVISNYDGLKGKLAPEEGLGFLLPGDPRSELVLSLFSSGDGLSLLLKGFDSYVTSTSPPTKKQIMEISPLAQVRTGTYKVPTFIIHGEYDEVLPARLGVNFISELKGKGIDAGIVVAEGAKHVFDSRLRSGSGEWEKWIKPGIEFLLDHL